LQAKAARVPCSQATQASADAGLRENGPVPSGCARNQAMRRCSSFIWHHQTSLLAPRLKRLLLVPGLISGSNAAVIHVLTGPSTMLLAGYAAAGRQYSVHDDNGTDENIRKPALRDAPGLLRGLRGYLDTGSCFMRSQLAISREPWDNDVVQSSLRLSGAVAGK